MRKHRTDLAYEEVLDLQDNENFTHTKKSYRGITTHHISIHHPCEEIEKQPGEYITIELDDLNDATQRKEAIAVTADCLKQVVEGLKCTGTRTLIVGLGNQEITADSLGPMAAREVIVTAHLHRLNEAELAQGTSEVAVIIPGVMGQTGLETAEFVQAVAGSLSPTL